MTSLSRQRWAVIGGGLLGLTLGRDLARAGHRVTLYEAAPDLGGLAAAWTLGPVTWDRHYHVILGSDAALLGLLDELGLGGEVRWSSTRTGFYVDGRLYSMSNALDFLRFPPLGPVDKLRLAATLLRAARLRRWEPLEDITAVQWLSRWSGPRTVERMWLPLLRAKLGAAAERASAAFIWAIIARMYGARRTGAKTERMGYVRGGYGRVLSRFGAALAEAGVVLRAGCPIRRVASREDGLAVEPFQGPAEVFDRVVVTAPGPAAARLCPDLPDAERARHAAVEYQGIVCASLLLRRPLAGYYVTNITDASVPFSGIIEMTSLVDPAELDGHHLVYLPRYAAPSDPVFDRSDDALESESLAALQRLYPEIRRADIVAFRVSRVRAVFPLPVLGYSRRLPPMATSHPGLWVVNSAHIVNGTLNVNETAQLARRVLPQLLADAPWARAAVAAAAV